MKRNFLNVKKKRKKTDILELRCIVTNEKIHHKSSVVDFSRKYNI